MFIEDLFSTYLYTGTGATQTITNGIDLSGSGGFTWIKDRASSNQLLMTTAGGPTNRLRSNGIPSYVTSTAGRDFSSFNSNGFSLGIDEQSSINTSAAAYVSWSFRKQPKFFDVVTWTGNGANRTIAHNLGSVPGCIIVASTTYVGSNWGVYHSSLANTEYLALNTTDAKNTGATYWNSTTPTASVFSLGTDATVNYNGSSYIAYLFASNAGGFPVSGGGSTNGITCGSFTTDGSGNATVSLGYEPQWLMVKASTYAQSWYIEDNMRAFNLTSRAILFPNLGNAEATGASAYLAPSSTGFAAVNGQLNASTTYIYIAIRRGPMKTPTVGTSVFSPIASSAAQGTQQTTGFTVDLQIAAYRPGNANNSTANDRLRGVSSTSTENTSTPLITSSTTFEIPGGVGTQNWDNTGFAIGSFLSSSSSIYWNLSRAPSVFDVVCYTGTGVARTVTHNLGVAPELIITKNRGAPTGWTTYCTYLPAPLDDRLSLQTASAKATTSGTWKIPDASTWGMDISFSSINQSGNTYVSYLFATCAGVSKVGSYTGTGTTQTINCGFTAGSRFVLIKRTDDVGDWYVWDSARGIVAGNDPYLLLNDIAAEVTGTDYIDTANAGFEISSTAPAAINANGGSFIFLAIA
jgi:hypothetical protein